MDNLAKITINEAPDRPVPSKYKNSTFDIISKVSYLIGVPQHVFENPAVPQKLEIFTELEDNKAARIIRNLCMIRTAIIKSFKYINIAMRTEYRSIYAMPEYLPIQAIDQLYADGVVFIKKTSTKLCHHIMEINQIICDRINNCKDIFPTWLNWEYIRELFIMPDGAKDFGTKREAEKYYASKPCYPYGIYINWREPKEEGNILYSDKKFVSLLYQWHDDEFTDFSKISAENRAAQQNIYDFLDTSNKVMFVVDCENSDPYRLCATLKALDKTYREKISSIILFDDVHASSAWKIFDNFTIVPIERILIERIKENKSLVDIKLTARTCQEFYANHTDSFVIVSSDSDFWGLISSLPEAKFFVMVEHKKCGPDLKNALIEKDIHYCYIDEFYLGNAELLKKGVLFREMQAYIKEHMQLNIQDMFNTALTSARISMDEAERNQFIKKHIKSMQIQIDDNGDVSFEFKI